MTRRACAILAAVVAVALATNARATQSSFKTMDAAAVAFVKLVQENYAGAKNQEYCAWIIAAQDGKFFIGVISEDADMNHCKMPNPRPAGTVASVHTHPTSAGGSSLDAAGQVFSEGDFAGTEWKGPDGKQTLPGYLGAPAGHVLRYDPGGTECKGSTLIRRNFKVVSGLSAEQVQRLPIVPGKFMPLFDQGGKAVPKPAYCKQL